MKGIIFTGDHVLKIIAGTKTQTRRLIIPQPPHENWNPKWHSEHTEVLIGYTNDGKLRNDGGGTNGRCEWKPRYRIGETLYCKETWTLTTGRASKFAKAGKPIYQVDHGRTCGGQEYDLAKWKSSMFMPEWASRCHIRIVSVKAERLQDIREEDAKMEGVEMPDGIAEPPDFWSYRQEYLMLLDRINPKRPSESNPWVFAYTFGAHENK